MKRTTTLQRVALYAVMTIALMCAGLAPSNSDAIQVQSTVTPTVDPLVAYMEEQRIEESNKYRDRQIECLATNIYFEARGEPKKGQAAVGLVTVNRTRSRIFPDDICGVVRQGMHDKKGRPLRNQCQFSWYCDGRKNKINDAETYSAIRVLSTKIYDDYYVANTYHDITNGAEYFQRRDLEGYMRGKHVTAIIGEHVYYRMAKT